MPGKAYNSAQKTPLHLLIAKYYFGVRSRRMRWVGHVTCVEEKRIVYTVLFGKHEWQLEDITKTDLKSIGY
jgi:hypothetical protein